MKVSMFHLMPHRELPEDFEQTYDSVWVTPPYEELCDSERVGQYYNWTLDELLYAAEQGFDGICTNEHHQNAYGFMPNPNLMGTVLAKMTDREGLRDTAIVQMGATLPTHPVPARVAEEYAMLDCISGGRMVAGLPIGSSMDANQCYGIKPLEQRERFQEYHDFLLEAWNREEVFAWNGEYWQLPKVNIWPRPIQRPHPPFWVPGTGSATTQRFTIENDYCYCFLSYDGFKQAKGLVDVFWDRVDEHGAEMNPHRLGYLQLVTVAESDEKAEEAYAEHVEYFYHKTQHIPGHEFVMPGHLYHDDMMTALTRRAEAGMYGSDEEKDPKQMSYRDFVDEGYVVSGGPQTVADQLQDVARQLRTGNLMVLLQIGSMPHELTKKNIQLFAEEVMPELEGIWEDEWENRWWPEALREEEPVVAE